MTDISKKGRTMPKFFVDNDQIHGSQIAIIGQDVNHICNVLRLKVGSNILVCNKETAVNYNCNIKKMKTLIIDCDGELYPEYQFPLSKEVKAIEKETVICTILNQSTGEIEPSTYIHIFQGLPKADKLEWIIEKATEIGVKEITPVMMQRTVVKLDDKESLKKIYFKIYQNMI